MTAITDVITILETFAGKTLDNTQMLNIVENSINYRTADALTNEEKAQKYFDMVKGRLVQQAKAGAQTKANEENMAAAAAAADLAAADLV